MSIATELQNLNDNILDAYDAVQDKGGTVPANKNMVNLPTAINSVPAGTLGIPREVSAAGVYQRPGRSTGEIFALPADATDVGPYAFAYAFLDYNNITTFDASSLTAISGHHAFLHAFEYASSLSTVLFPSVTTISGSYAFNSAAKSSAREILQFPELKTLTTGNEFESAYEGGSLQTLVGFPKLESISGARGAFQYVCKSATALTTVSFPKLRTIDETYTFYYAFDGCRSLTSVDFPVLASISDAVFYFAFEDCVALASISFPALSNIASDKPFGGAFRRCTSLTSVSFPALTPDSFGTYTNQFWNMLYGVTGCTVHFPAAVQSTIGSWADVTGGFGGTNTTVLFDL